MHGAAALAPLIAQHGTPSSLLAKGFSNMFNSLALSILGQQLAVKAAKVITGRFMTLCQVSCRSSCSPSRIMSGLHVLCSPICHLYMTTQLT